jgi:hypothetical protein
MVHYNEIDLQLRQLALQTAANLSRTGTSADAILQEADKYYIWLWQVEKSEKQHRCCKDEETTS